MATGVKPRDEETSLTRADLETIQEAMKQKKFRDMFVEYCEEVRDPANQAIYQKEMTQLEKERGYDVTFINPKGGYVIKTSVAGEKKAFINICSNDNVAKPSCKIEEVNGTKGLNWQIPYSVIPPREDLNKKERCILYDVVFHPDTLRMAEVNKRFRQLVNNTAIDALTKTYNLHLDSNNLRFPKSAYKGMAIPAVIRKEDPNYKPPTGEESDELSQEIIDKLYPQQSYTQKEGTMKLEEDNKKQKQKKKSIWKSREFAHDTSNGYTIPKYVIKQQKSVELEDFTYNKDCKQYTAIPSHIVVEVNLPLLSSTKDCTLDVQDKCLHLIAERPAKYKLDVTLPYSVNDQCGSAKFDKSKHMLFVTLPVIKKNNLSDNRNLKTDSGVESEGNSSSLSDDEQPNRNLVVEISSSEGPVHNTEDTQLVHKADPLFFEPSIGYIFPSYTHNVLDETVAFTFHVKNTEPESVKVKKEGDTVLIKFTSVGSGYVPVHYAAMIVFENEVVFEDISGEAWDNNVILQLNVNGDLPDKFQIGLDRDSLACGTFEISPDKHKPNSEEKKDTEEDNLPPVVEVTNLGTETNIVVFTNQEDYDEDDDIESPTSNNEKEITWTDTSNVDNGAKSILRKPIAMMRSYSESSCGDVASSMDYISSDCIPEESSLKKTVRFNNVIARQFYRYNSSIERQKKKNQRRKSKKRNQDRRKSESEAEDDIDATKSSAPRLKSVLKQRRDSGLADTSDADTDSRNTPQDSQFHDAATKENSADTNTDIDSVLNIVDNKNAIDKQTEPTIWESETSSNVTITQEKEDEQSDVKEVKHNTNLYNPDNLNKGLYLEVKFKNDLIFDLDM